MLLPGPVGLWTAALEAVEAPAVGDVVGALDEQGWDALWFGEADFVRGGSDRLRSAMVVGGEDAIAARVQEHLDAGADHVCLQVLGESVLDLPQADWARLAPVVADRRRAPGTLSR